MWDFEHGAAQSLFDISYTLPSRCAASLKAGSADIGIIPAAAYPGNPELNVLPGVAIASRNAVRSILLVSKAPVEQVRTVAMDNSSLTSVALTKVLFAKHWGGERTYASMEPDLHSMLAKCDAGLIIGDPALQIDRSRYITYDLADEWVRWTRKPFVFAFWAVRQAAVADLASNLDLPSIFQESRNHGLLPPNLEKIVDGWTRRLPLSKADIRTYLTQNIHYYLDAECIAGLRLFYEYAAECGVLPRVASLHFLADVKTAVS